MDNPPRERDTSAGPAASADTSPGTSNLVGLFDGTPPENLEAAPPPGSMAPAAARFDMFIVGGGINGAGIARDAAGRGLSVALCERDDFGGATSSASTKLIHGGLRYLEHYEFRLVAQALAEREILLGVAPHLIHPLRFIMPHARDLRPAWLIRLGLFLYDRLGGPSSLPRSQSVQLANTVWGEGLKPEYRKGFMYFDASVDDARLVILNLLSAQQLGATILARTRFVTAERVKDEGGKDDAESGYWRITVEDGHSGERRQIEARMLVNASGPWVGQVAATLGQDPGRAQVRLVKGSHIVVPRLFEGEHAYIMQDAGKRVIFMIPFQRDFTLIGTTDTPVDGLDSLEQAPAISTQEVAYLCQTASHYARKNIDPDMVVWTYSGVRPLYDNGVDDPSAVTRDYTLLLEADAAIPQLSIYGGKITTYRRLAEAVLDKLGPWLQAKSGPWTASAPLPGAEFGPRGGAGCREQLLQRYPQLPPDLLEDLFRRHGTLAFTVLGQAVTPADLGQNFGGGLHEQEVHYLIDREWASQADDILWRRTKAGLHMTPGQRQDFTVWMRKNTPIPTPSPWAGAVAGNVLPDRS